MPQVGNVHFPYTREGIKAAKREAERTGQKLRLPSLATKVLKNADGARSFRHGGEVYQGMGFKKAQQQIARRQGISMERAGAILAASTRRASAAARRRNPNLNKVR